MEEAMKDCCDNNIQENSASYKYPLTPLQQTDVTGLQVPFVTLPGESVSVLGVSTDGILALSNYRLYVESLTLNYNIPLGLIECCEVRDIFYLHIQCKEARTVRCTFSTNEQCMEWFKRLHRATQPPTTLHDIFAFSFYAWSIEVGDLEIISRLTGSSNDDYQPYTSEQLFKKEVERLRFDTHGAWRITQANTNYRLCSSYPPLLLVPACINDDTLEHVARFRSSRRIPVVVWRHTGNGAVIARCSQPEVGWLGWRSKEDEDLLKAMADACSFDRGAQSMLDISLDSSPLSLASNIDDHSSITTSAIPLSGGAKKVLIMDARSYTTAVANRARGGGCECPEYYPSCDIEFMNLANIHSIRKSFQAIRQLCASPPDQTNWFSLLESTRWLHHMSGLMRASTILASAIEREGRPVLVHCSDGWDRTPQIVAFGQILLDPYYRTIEGFRVLCEREWLDYGHKFADRCGHSIAQDDPNERCPVFLQWLDCVHQLLYQFPCCFEFSQTFLVKLAKHTYSNLFGTFLFNSRQERENKQIYSNTFSVWPFLTDINFRNHLYLPPANESEQVLWPSYNVRDLQLWSEMYLGSLEMDTSLENGSRTAPSSSGVNVTGNSNGSNGVLNENGTDVNAGVGTSCDVIMTKTRSFGDLLQMSTSVANNTQPRRCSDPNILTDSIKLETLSLESDDSPEKELTPEIPPNVLCRTNVNLIDDISNNSSGNNDDEDDETLSTTVNGDVTTTDAAKNLNNIVDDVNNVINCNNSVNEITYKKSETVIETQNDSVETSTETIVATGAVAGAASNGIGCHNIIASEFDDNSCKICTQRGRFKKRSITKNDLDMTMSPLHYVPSSPLSTTSSTSDSSSTKILSKNCDLDGLTPLQSSVQNRLRQIVTDHKAKEDALERELHKTRMALIQQVCNHCTGGGTNDNLTDLHDETCSVGGSVCSVGDGGGRVSANDSLPSDISWETLDEPSHIPDSIVSVPTLWVPDHAVSRCTGCHTEFWLGRRKHHCRNCGRIFCADCSENSAPLPNEQLYNPVRVCTTCYTSLGANNNITTTGTLLTICQDTAPNLDDKTTSEAARVSTNYVVDAL